MFNSNFEEELNRLRKSFEKKGINLRNEAEKKLYNVAEKVRDTAIEEAPVDTTMLKKSITIRQGRRNKSGMPIFYVGTAAPYARSVEFGSRPHIIRAKNGKYLRFIGKDGNEVFVKQVFHPGTKAQPFLRPALAKNENYIRKQLKDLADDFKGGKGS